MNIRSKVADLIMPWAAVNATVWPSQHAVHQDIMKEVKELWAETARLRAENERLRARLAEFHS